VSSPGAIPIVLAAHGAGDGSPANESLRLLAREVSSRTGERVLAAFHLGEPSFAGVLDLLDAPRVLVIPVMTGHGWSADAVLPRELAGNRRYPRVELRIAEPVGCHPGIAAIILDRAAAALARAGLAAAETGVVVAAHGTSKMPVSRASAEAAAASLRASGRFAGVRTAFLDDAPGVEETVAAMERPAVLVIPFFIGGGKHAGTDIPERAEAGLRRAGPAAAGRRLVIDEAVGADPRIADLVVEIAVRSLAEWAGGRA
jgi:sirohydrochlorin cobaltochelatase